MRRRCPAISIAAAAVATLGCTGAIAQTVIDDWAIVKVPPPPALASVTLDPKSTALLLLDFNGRDTTASGPCNAATKPRCRATIPRVRALLDKARASGAFVAYSLSTNGAAADIQPELAPILGDPAVKGGPDKFIGTDLGKLLEEKGIKTLIVTGTAAEGAVLDTGTDAALHGSTVVVPVDAISSTEPYAEQYVAWHLTHAPGVAQKTVLTRSDMIGF